MAHAQVEATLRQIDVAGQRRQRQAPSSEAINGKVYEANDPEIRAMLARTREGSPRSVAGWVSRARDKAKSLFQTFHMLRGDDVVSPDGVRKTMHWAMERDDFRRLHGLVINAKVRSENTIRSLLSGLTNNEFELWANKFLLEDLKEDYRRGIDNALSVQKGGDPDVAYAAVLKELQSIDAELQKHPRVQESLQLTKELLNGIAERRIAAGQMPDVNAKDILSNGPREWYLPHEIMDFMKSNRSQVSGNAKLGSLASNRQRKGTFRDVNRDVLNVDRKSVV